MKYYGYCIKSCMFALMLLLTSQAHADPDWFLHPEALLRQVKQCQQQGPSEHCRQIDRARAAFAQRLIQVEREPQVFGQHIMQLQNKQAKLESALHQQPGDNTLQAELAALKLQIQRAYALVRVVGE